MTPPGENSTYPGNRRPFQIIPWRLSAVSSNHRPGPFEMKAAIILYILASLWVTVCLLFSARARVNVPDDYDPPAPTKNKRGHKLGKWLSINKGIR